MPGSQCACEIDLYPAATIYTHTHTHSLSMVLCKSVHYCWSVDEPSLAPFLSAGPGKQPADESGLSLLDPISGSHAAVNVSL